MIGQIIYGIILVLWLYAMFAPNGLLHMYRCSYQFLKRADFLKDPKESAATRERLNNTEEFSFFSDRTLQEQMKLFQFEVNRESDLGKDRLLCDIGEFFNRDLIDQIGNRLILDQFSGAMTSLGILGTFFGLTGGITGFQYGSTKELGESVSTLLNGMGLAFNTSIVGLISSLIFIYVYKTLSTHIEQNMDLFLDSFRSNVFTNHETLGTTRAYNNIADLCQTNREASIKLENINKELQNVASSISVLQESVSKLAPSETSELLRDIKTSMDSIQLDQITGEIGRLREAIVEHDSSLEEQQRNALRFMVNTFISKLNESLKTQFQDLGAGVTEASNNYRSFAATIKEVNRAFLNVQQGFINMSDKTADFTNQVVSNTSSINDLHSCYINDLSMMSQLYRDNESVMDSLTSLVNAFDKYALVTESNLKRMSNIDADLAGENESFESSMMEISSSISEVSNALKSSADALSSHQHNIENSLVDMQKTAKRLAEDFDNLEKIRSAFENTPAYKDVEIAYKHDETMEKIFKEIHEMNRLLAKKSQSPFRKIIDFFRDI